MFFWSRLDMKNSSLLNTLVGKKYIVGITGLFLCSFLVLHLSGNLLLFKNDNGISFNLYAKFMSTNPIIRVSEIFLFLAFIIHIGMAMVITWHNKKARPISYQKTSSETSSFFSRHMFFTGSMLLIFLVVHLKQFFVESRFKGEHNLYLLVKSAFEDEIYVIFYCISLLFLSFHLFHGFQSAFQTFGINHHKLTPMIKKLGILFAVFIPIGFAIIPLYFYAQKVGIL